MLFLFFGTFFFADLVVILDSFSNLINSVDSAERCFCAEALKLKRKSELERKNRSASSQKSYDPPPKQTANKNCVHYANKHTSDDVVLLFKIYISRHLHRSGHFTMALQVPTAVDHSLFAAVRLCGTDLHIIHCALYLQELSVSQ